MSPTETSIPASAWLTIAFLTVALASQPRIPSIRRAAMSRNAPAWGVSASDMNVTGDAGVPLTSIVPCTQIPIGSAVGAGGVGRARTSTPAAICRVPVEQTRTSSATRKYGLSVWLQVTVPSQRYRSGQ